MKLRSLLLLALFMLSARSILAANTKNIYLGHGKYEGDLLENMTILPDGLYYPRDYSFPLEHVNGKQYIPRNVSQEDFELFSFMFSQIAAGFYIDEYGHQCVASKYALFGGNGFSSDGYVEKSVKLMRYFKENNISHKAPGQTIVEGGNIHFVSHAQKTKAIIGDHALLLTYMIIDRENAWPLAKIEQIAAHLPNANRHFHLARNADLLMAVFLQSLLGINPAPEDIERIVTAELSDEEKHRIEKAAKTASARILWCKRLIAEELELPVDDLVFIPQRRYHIDLDLLVTPHGKIVLRAPTTQNEREIWSLQQNILQKHFSDNMVDVSEQFSNAYMFCGLSIPKDNWFIFPNVDEGLAELFSKFLIEQCGIARAIPIQGNSLFQIKQMGFHCLTQEYFHNPELRQNSCAQCGKLENLLRCTRCKAVYYCNAECQKINWPSHVPICRQKK